MKKRKTIIIVFVSVLVALLFVVFVFPGVNFRKSSTEVLPFDVTEDFWQEKIKEFPSDIDVGKTDTVELAKKNAQLVWSQVFSETNAKTDIMYDFWYDDVNRVWRVWGFLPLYSSGGYYHVLIEESGDVLAVWETR